MRNLLILRVHNLYRICPGKDFADASLFLLIANMITTLDISKAQDDNGSDIDPPYEFIQGVTRYTLPNRIATSSLTTSVQSTKVFQMQNLSQIIEGCQAHPSNACDHKG